MKSIGDIRIREHSVHSDVIVIDDGLISICNINYAGCYIRHFGFVDGVDLIIDGVDNYLV